MKKFDGISEFLKFKRGQEPEQARKAFEKLEGFVQGWIDGTDVWPGFVFHGGIGCCKTSVAIMIGNKMFEAGRWAHIGIASVVVDAFKDMIRGDTSELTERDAMQQYLKPDLLILDDVGIQARTNFEAVEFYKMLVQRDNRLKPTIITTNLDLDTKEGESALISCVSHQVADRLKGYFVDADQWGGNVR